MISRQYNAIPSLDKAEYFFTSDCVYCIIDLRVYNFFVIANLANLDEKDKITAIRLRWASIFSLPVPFLRNASKLKLIPIVVDDCRIPEYSYGGVPNYWRNKYLIERGLPAYKGQRAPHSLPGLVDEGLKIAREFIQFNKIPYFVERGFEADDFAGLFVRAVKKKLITGHTLLCTVDSDWHQLVSDEDKIRFANTYSHPPRLRSEIEVIKWCKKKKIDIASPRGIVQMKSVYGDSSDNLGPGTAEGLIDLLNPFERPSMSEEAIAEKIAAAAAADCNTAKAANNQLIRDFGLTSGL